MASASNSIVAESNPDLKLNGENYVVWSMKVRKLLEEREILDSLSSVMPKPMSQHRKDLETYMAWREKNSTACMILLSAMDDEIATKFNSYDNAMDLWIALKHKFGCVSLTNLRFTALKFDTYKMCHDHTMKMHLKEMSNMINELSDAGQKMTEEQKVQAVIRSLPDKWDHMRMHLILTENIRTFEDAARHLELEEDRLASIKTNVEAHFVGTTSYANCSNTNANKRGRFDEYDKEHNKLKQDQEGDKPKGKKSRVKCSNCDQKGHYASECTLPNSNIQSSARDQLVFPRRSGMQVHVEIATDKKITLEVESSDTIDNLTAKLRDICYVPAYGYRLIFDGMQLVGERTLASYNILNQSTIFLLIFPRRR